MLSDGIENYNKVQEKTWYSTPTRSPNGFIWGVSSAYHARTRKKGKERKSTMQQWALKHHDDIPNLHPKKSIICHNDKQRHTPVLLSHGTHTTVNLLVSHISHQPYGIELGLPLDEGKCGWGESQTPNKITFITIITNHKNVYPTLERPLHTFPLKSVQYEIK